ncbi:xylulokinase [Luteolibacter ambystomatis]|uniref:Xylulokinase n=1 Tax=Luteolibacter ambystomatis TaxID=2824561 RepID=A0A975GA21_9BACT|nr:FGGY family carbohydrate kinase [Luteolibacter ambystomatis]QUE51220.1 xylulokinase [Luteolibacter ambystomatis]
MYFLGIEINPAGTRVVALDLEAAEIAAEAVAPHAWIEGLPPGYREQDPAGWINAVDHVMRECLATLGERRGRVAAIGVAGPLRGTVALDASSRVIRPAKLAGDLSSKRQAEEISRVFGGTPGLLELLGQVPGVDSLAAECLWLKQQEPYHFQKTAFFLPAQDFITYWLTGERATESGSASTTGLFDIRSCRWSAELVHAIDPGLAERLPPLQSPVEPRGQLRPALAQAWGLSEAVQVGAGSASPMLSALAAGCVTDGSIAVELGSSGTIVGVQDSPVIDLRGEISPLCSATGGWLGTATIANAVTAVELVRRHYGWTPEQFEQAVASAPPGADGLLFLPYLTGESLPRLPEGCGVLHGMTLQNFSPAGFARAAAEGVALGLGYGVSRLTDLGFEPVEIRLLGAASVSRTTRQLLADVFGMPVVPVGSRQGPAVGAAMQAAVAFFRQSGESLGFGEIASYLVSSEAHGRCEPDMRRHELYQHLMSRQQYLVDTLQPAGFL